MERFARLVLHHRKVVFFGWLLVFAAGIFAASATPGRLTVDFSLPGQPGYEADVQIIETYGVSTNDALLPVITVPEGTTVAAQRDKIGSIVSDLRTAFPEEQFIDVSQDPKLVTKDGRTTFVLVRAPMPTTFDYTLPDEISPVLAQKATAAGFTSGLTSYGVLAQGESSGDASVLFETMLGGVGALAVLLFVFASLLALVPLVVAGVAILATFLLVLGMTTFTDVSFIVQFLIALVGLGVAIDYSLLVVSRWREELAHGRTNEEATVVAIETAGHAVLASGVTVAISLVALVVVPVPFLRSMGFGGMLIPLVSVAVVLTLLPALLSTIGPKVDWPKIRKEGTAARGWSAWARLVVRFRFVAAALALALLAVIIAPVFGLKIGQANTDSLARTGPAYEALQRLETGGIGSGVLTPVTLLVPAAAQQQAVDATTSLAGVTTSVAGPVKDGSALVDVFPTAETVDNDSNAVVSRIREAAQDAVDGQVQVAGSGPVVEDYSHAVYDKMPYVLLLIAVITFILLVRTFRSVLLPLKAVLLNLVSLAAVFGFVTFFWQDGHGSGALFNTSATGAVTFWLPILIFAFLFGLSMDYEVFILARMREEYDRTGSTSQAVITGLGRTGRLVTSAALILFFAFLALATGPMTDIKVLGTALGVGILIDATIVRALLVPALVSLFGRWNWWLPDWLAKVLFVQPSPLHPKQDELWDVDHRRGDESTPTRAEV